MEWAPKSAAQAIIDYLKSERELLKHKNVQRCIQEVSSIHRKDSEGGGKYGIDNPPDILSAYDDAGRLYDMAAKNKAKQENDDDFLFHKRFVILFQGSERIKGMNSDLDTCALAYTVHMQLESFLSHIHSNKAWDIPPCSANPDGQLADEELVLAKVYLLSLSIREKFADMEVLASKGGLTKDKKTACEANITKLKKERKPFEEATRALVTRGGFDADMEEAKAIEDKWEKVVRALVVAKEKGKNA